MTLEDLHKELQELKARAAADTAFLRCAIFTLGTPQLRGACLAMANLFEEMSVKLLYMQNASDQANHAFNERKKFWLDALEAEIAARGTAVQP